MILLIKSLSLSYAHASLYFDIKDSNGRSFEEGEVLFQQAMYLNYPYPLNEWVVDEWYPLKRGLEGYFGEIDFPLFWDGAYKSEEEKYFVRKRYYLFQYSNSEIIDSLFVRDSIRVDEFRRFEIFLNGKKIDSSEIDGDYFSRLISITHEE